MTTTEVWFNTTRAVLAAVGLVWLGGAIWLLARAGAFEDPAFGRMIATVAVGAVLWACIHLVAAWRARAGSGWGRATGLSIGVLGLLGGLVLFVGGLTAPLPDWMAVLGALAGLVYGLVLAGFGLAGAA